MIIGKDAALQLYRSVFSILTKDEALSTLLAGSATNDDQAAQNAADSRVFETFVEFDSGEALTYTAWITFSTIRDAPFETEQTQDIRDIILDINIWTRGPGSLAAEIIEKRVRQLMDHADLATDTLLVYYCLSSGYGKAYEIASSLWRVISTFKIMCMAIEPD